MPNQAVLILKRKDDRNGNPKSFDVLRAENTVDAGLRDLDEGSYTVFGNGEAAEYKVEYVQRNTKL